MPYEVFEYLVAIIEGLKNAYFADMVVHLIRMDQLLALGNFIVKVT